MLRLLTILITFIRFRLDLLIDKSCLPLPIKIVLSPLSLLPKPKAAAAKRLRLALESLGPIFIKFGQMLSTRKDLLGPEFANELEHLQDNVPPFNNDLAKNIIETALGQSIDTLFADFSNEPLASASIAQVHSATLHSGQEVVVKVVRPNIEFIIEKDVELLFLGAKLIGKLHPEGSRLRALEVVEDYRHTIFDELDLKKEAANTSQLRRNFIDSDLLYIPEIHWDYCRSNVLVMERIHGIPVTDIDALNAAGVNMRNLAERGVEIFFTQVFRDSFFHADMHPGNIFVAHKTPEKPQYIGIDCAIIGSLSESDQYYLARNLLAILNRDYRLVAKLHVECGWVPPETRAIDFESSIRSVCEPIFEKPLGEISFGQLLMHLFQTARRFNMEVQPSLILLQKTLLNVEGLGRQLYPELDLWSTAKPFLENWMRERYSPKSIIKHLQQHAPGWLEQLPMIPDLIFERLNTPSHAHHPGNNALQKQWLHRLKIQQRINFLSFSLITVIAAIGTYHWVIGLRMIGL